MKEIEAVITGDIVDSTKLSLEERKIMLASLESLPEVLLPIEKVNVEIFRGDSFQIGLINAFNSLKIALTVRAFLRTHKMAAANMLLDCRVAVGIGTVDYQSDTLSTSDGSAFRISGRLLDRMKKRRLEICTPWEDVNEELKLNTAFADDIISSWTQSQSKVELANYIFSKNRNEIATYIGVSRQMVDKSLRASKETLIKAYLNRFEKLIESKMNEEK